MAGDGSNRVGPRVGPVGRGVDGVKVHKPGRKPVSRAAATPHSGDHVARGEKPKAPAAPRSTAGGVAGRSLEAMKGKLLGKAADPVATTVASFEGLPDSVAASLLADLIRDQLEIA